LGFTSFAASVSAFVAGGFWWRLGSSTRAGTLDSKVSMRLLFAAGREPAHATTASATRTAIEGLSLADKCLFLRRGLG
jgi:hypothetical protein